MPDQLIDLVPSEAKGEYYDGVHVTMEVGDAELNEYQKRFYTQKWAEINEFLETFKFNSVSCESSDNTSSTVAHESGQNVNTTASIISINGKSFIIPNLPGAPSNLPGAPSSTQFSLPSAMPIVSQSTAQTAVSQAVHHLPQTTPSIRLRPEFQAPVPPNDTASRVVSVTIKAPSVTIPTVTVAASSASLSGKVVSRKSPQPSSNEHLKQTTPAKQASVINYYSPKLPPSSSTFIVDRASPQQQMQPELITLSTGIADLSSTSHTTPSASMNKGLPLLPLTRSEQGSKSPLVELPGSTRSLVTPSFAQSQSTNANSTPNSFTVDLTTFPDALSNGTSSIHNVAKIEVKERQITKEKTFPSLVVSARASLKIYQQALINNDRLMLDNQIRKVMQMKPKLLIEYLLQKGLLRSEHICKTHGKHLRLGEYSDPEKYAQHGGYVWFSECCTPRIHYVTKGSIFDHSVLNPQTILKLMYHWSCNTAVHNIISWVKVDNFIVKTYFTFFRAICTLAVSEKFPLLGGPKKKIQIGIISIATNNITPKGKDVKVDILAAMDPVTQQVRLRALENFFTWPSNKVYESKFRRILEVLKMWVHPDTIIITDFAVDFSLAQTYGFKNIVLSGGRNSNQNNVGALDYLRGKIPAMFQSTLNVLSLQIIQQFLDELVWRETWGCYAAIAFDALVEHTAQITKLPGPDLIQKLKRAASQPFRNWKFSMFHKDYIQKLKEPQPSSSPSSPQSVASPKVYTAAQSSTPIQQLEKLSRKPVASSTSLTAASPIPERPSDPPVKQDTSSPRTNDPPSDSENILLESYYYGFISGNSRLQKPIGTFLAECLYCKRDFLTATAFTNHLIQHAFNSNTDLSILSQKQLYDLCTKCFCKVRDLADHLSHKHLEQQTPLNCKICRSNLVTKEKLFKHMSYVHRELELPYMCELCGFRTSIYDDAANHFKLCHDKDTCLQCPYCFKIVRCCSNNEELPRNVIYFVQHIQKHSNPKLNRKCEKCALSFINMGTLKEHQEKFHVSVKSNSEIERYKAERPTTMPRPLVEPYPPVTLHESSFHTLNGRALSTSVKVAPYFSSYKCAECDSPIAQNHLTAKMTCTKCKFQSHCANAIREHSARFHMGTLPNAKSQMLGGFSSLDKPIYCWNCPYSTKNGDLMAKHLIDCKSAFIVNGKNTDVISYKRKFATFEPPRKFLKTKMSTQSRF